MPIYPYSFQLPPLNLQDIPSNGAVGEFLGISAGGVLDWLPVATGGGDMLKSENLSGLANYTTARTNIGLGTASTPTFANLTLTSPSLASSAPVTISQTWGTTGTYTAAKVNVTETATANPASLLLDLQLGSVSRVKVNKEGNLVIAAVSGAMIQCTASSQGVLSSASAFPKIWGARFDFQTAAGGTTMLGIGPTQVEIPTQLVFNTDTILLRDGAANTLALRNGAAAQTFNVYGTYTSGSVYERMFMRYNGTDLAFQVGAETLGATARPLQLWTGGASRLHITTAGNVGIGTTAPNSRLEVRDITNNANTVGQMLILSTDALAVDKGGRFGLGGIYDGSGNTALWAEVAGLKENATSGNYAGYLTLRTRAAGAGQSTDRLRIDSVGNVGIGTTSPTSKLHVAGTIKPEQATMVDTALTTYTLASTDAGTIINCTAATAVTVNLPTLDTNAGYNVMIIQSGAGAVTIAQNGNTRNSFGSAFTTAGQHAACSIVRTAASTYNLSGNLV